MFFQLFVFAAGRRLTPRSLCCSCAFVLCLFFVSAIDSSVSVQSCTYIRTYLRYFVYTSTVHPFDPVSSTWAAGLTLPESWTVDGCGPPPSSSELAHIPSPSPSRDATRSWRVAPPLLQRVWLGRRPPQNAGGRGPWTLPLARSVCPAGPVPDGHNAHGGALAAAVRVPGPHHARSDSVTCRPLSPAQVVGLVLAVLPPCTPTCASFLPPRPPVYPLLLATAHHGGLCRCRGRPVCGGRPCGARRLRVAVVGVCGGATRAR